jgi:hypothetical protein
MEQSGKIRKKLKTWHLQLTIEPKLVMFLGVEILSSPSFRESYNAIIVSRATEKKWRTLDNTRSILWKKFRGVSWATEKKWRTLDNTRSILWKKFRGCHNL